MARQRLVKPEFFQHQCLHRADTVHALPCRLAYIGLWTQCDRRGLFRWDPVRLKLNVLPFDDVDFAKVLDALHKEGFVEPYEVEGRRYGWVPNFMKHQRFHINEKADPSIPEYRAGTMPARKRHRASTVQAPSQHGVSTPDTDTDTDTDEVLTTPPRRAKKPRVSVPAENWVADLVEWWIANIGGVTHGQLGKLAKPVHAAKGLGPIKTAALRYFGPNGKKGYRSAADFFATFAEWERETPVVRPIRPEPQPESPSERLARMGAL